MRRRSVLYAVAYSDGRLSFGHSPRPEVDARFWLGRGAQRVVPLGPSLPPMWAEIACRELRTAPIVNGSSAVDSARPQAGTSPFERLLGRIIPFRPVEGWERAIQRAAARARKRLREEGYDWVRRPLPGPAVAGPLPGNLALPDPAPVTLDALVSLLRGRLLTGPEVVRQVERAALALDRPLEECLTWLVLQERVHRVPGVYPTPIGELRCSRCGETDHVRPWDCAACGERRCWRCEACRELGPVTACLFLYAAEIEDAREPVLRMRQRACGQSAPPNAASARPLAGLRPPETASPDSLCDGTPVVVRLPALTSAQRRAAWALDRFVRLPEHREALVWAVCGAGKTEVTFLAASRVLKRGGRVLFAVPRRDVVAELGPRLIAAFPSTSVRVLHGGPDRIDQPGLEPGSLTIATTHQLLRFYRAFDLAILDEVDAYPYRGSAMLARALARAIRENGLLVRMSATPDEALIREAKTGRSLLVPIPARHHGHPLPVPEIVVDRHLDASEGEKPFVPSDLVLSLVRRSLFAVPPARLLVFVPTVALSERVGRGMAAALTPVTGPGRVAWSHSRDPGRERKRRAFHSGELAVLVATTILERGITVPDVDVIVLFSDMEHIFQTAALIQMAGRVGRTAARPQGRVAFVGRRITRAMRTAVAQIEYMNDLARRMGLLRA